LTVHFLIASQRLASARSGGLSLFVIVISFTHLHCHYSSFVYSLFIDT
jgi:hypothetical protein